MCASRSAEGRENTEIAELRGSCRSCVNQAYSPNVAYELGMMHSQGKECLIMKHASLPSVRFDLIKDLHEVYDRDLQVRAPGGTVGPSNWGT